MVSDGAAGAAVGPFEGDDDGSAVEHDVSTIADFTTAGAGAGALVGGVTGGLAGAATGAAVGAALGFVAGVAWVVGRHLE